MWEILATNVPASSWCVASVDGVSRYQDTQGTCPVGLLGAVQLKDDRESLRLVMFGRR
jgi:hypothetical protein